MLNQRCTNYHMWWALARWPSVRQGDTLDHDFISCMDDFGYKGVSVQWLESLKCA
jgi:hypothetical protein